MRETVVDRVPSRSTPRVSVTDLLKQGNTAIRLGDLCFAEHRFDRCARFS